MNIRLMNILQQKMQMQSRMELHLQCALSRDAGQLDSRWATVAKGSREVGKLMLLLALLLALLLLLLGLGIAADADALSSNSSCSAFYESVSRSGAPRSKQANKHQPSPPPLPPLHCRQHHLVYENVLVVVLSLSCTQ